MKKPKTEIEKIYVNDISAAHRLDLAPQSLRNWRFQGRGPAYVKAGRSVRYLISDLDNFMQSNRIEHGQK